jgi:predicted acylesterase/phospholipase RssA
MSTQPVTRTLGLALSGGGSRASAFHRGTLQGLRDLGLVERIDVISTVSGGSLFGAAWMAARIDGTSDIDFLKHMREELAKGFVCRSVRPRLLKSLIPGIRYSRTNVIADTFDKIFFHGRELAKLPERPSLCINTTVLNNGQVGKFSRYGFSAWGLRLPGASPSHQVPVAGFPISLAVGASAAFPIGLPPVELSRRDFPAEIEFEMSLAGAQRIALTDGGVLENLGIQTLLKSQRFSTWDMIVSDAGTASKSWEAGSLLNPLRSFSTWVLSGQTLDQIMLVMNDKQNRWARQQVIEEIQSSWLADSLRKGRGGPGLPIFLSTGRPLSKRNVLFVRVAQDWSGFLRSIPSYRLEELRAGTGRLPDLKDSGAVERFLKAVGVDLSPAKRYYYDALGGDKGAQSMNAVATNFTALSGRVLDQLSAHAAWQVHATHAIYGI